MKYLVIRNKSNNIEINKIVLKNSGSYYISILKQKIYKNLNWDYYISIEDSNKINMIENELVFVDTFAKMESVMEQFKDKKVRIAYSGGADSDTLLWLFRYKGYDVSAVFYDTGLEYDATWKQIEYMKSQGFNIDIIKAKRPIPTSNKKYGHPFISKFVSEMLQRLQHHNFDFQNDGNKTFDELVVQYPKAKSALRWWTNTHNGMRNNIKWNKNLKEFLIENGLPFKVSSKCCEGAKKLPIKEYMKENVIDLIIMGIRKAEGGSRASAYKNCFVPSKSYSYSMYFPMFWWKKEDKEKFDKEMGIIHSACYTQYGLERTGCAGCPFGQNFEKELLAIDQFEPRLSKGINNIFNKSYEWTRKYKEYAENQK